MIQKFFLLILLTSVTISPIVAQGVIRWGSGILNPPQHLKCGGCDAALPNGIPAYEKPGGRVIDSIKMDGFYYPTRAGGEYNFNEILQVECMSSVKYLKFFDTSGEYLRILPDAFPNGFWIKKPDIEKAGFKLESYLEMMSRLNSKFFVPTGASPVPLRKDPDKSALVIMEIPPLIKQEGVAVYEIQLLPNGIKGNWWKVNVVKYSQSECLEDFGQQKFVRAWTGWVKAVDDSTGAPNFWINMCCMFD